MLQKIKYLKKYAIAIVALFIITSGTTIYATELNFTYNDSSGLSAAARMFVDEGQLVVILTNTSTGAPNGFDNAMQLLTSIAFALPDGTFISSGSVLISEGSYSENFDNVSPQLVGGDSVSTEWGYGNSGGTGFGTHLNFITAMASHSNPFASPLPNLDGPKNLDGPQAGLTNGVLSLGGLGAINNSVTAFIEISGIDLTDESNEGFFLAYILSNGAIFEFGSDALFGSGTGTFTGTSTLPIPEPSTILLLLAGLTFISIKKIVSRKK